MLLSSNLILLWSGTYTWAKYLKTLKYSTVGFIPLHASLRVLFWTARVGLVLRTCTHHLTTSGYKALEPFSL
jgi:hypothetical protein